MRACEGIIVDALKDCTPFIRECLRQCCSALGCQGSSARWPCCPLEPAVQAEQPVLMLPVLMLPVLLCLLPCQL